MEIKLEQVRALIELMVEHDLSRIEISEGEGHILLRRGQPVIATGLGAAPMVPAAAALHAPGVSQPAPAPAAAPMPADAPAEREITIKSPMVGTYYASPEPDAAPFVSAGTVVNPNTVVCLVEAMKVFNEIKAEMSGRITKVLVKSGQAVEFDQPLFAVSPT